MTYYVKTLKKKLGGNFNIEKAIEEINKEKGEIVSIFPIGYVGDTITIRIIYKK